MGIFSKKATDVELAYESKQTTGLVLVLSGERKRETPMSNYDIHKPALRNIVEKFEKAAEYDDEGAIVPVIVRFDLESPYKPSLGVYFGKVQVGWVLKDYADKFVQILESDGRKGVGILGELALDRGDENREIIFHELYLSF